MLNITLNLIHSVIDLLILSPEGIPTEELLEEMLKLKSQEINPEDGKMFAYVYTGEGDTFDAQRKAFDMFTGEELQHSYIF